MGLGDKAAALALSERAMAALPTEKDAVTGPIPIEILARVAAQLGEPDRAVLSARANRFRNARTQQRATPSPLTAWTCERFKSLTTTALSPSFSVIFSRPPPTPWTMQPTT